MKLFNKLLGIHRGDVVSIVGSGGKTTLMFTLARELSSKNKVLVTTTTKIYVPHNHEFDFMTCSCEEYCKYNNMKYNGIYVYGSSIDSEGKLIGLEAHILEMQAGYFDYVLIEADGSKNKPIKGWNYNEPVVAGTTTKTVGVLPIDIIGRRVNNENVHRMEQFINITGSHFEDIINTDHIISLIFHKKGLFKNSTGERILFVNKVETNSAAALFQKLETGILRLNRGYIDRITSGSLKGGI